ncbi:MAG: glycosyltransferase family 2 protein [Neisseriaceae bacterium]|nr:glycosyltransferase family 2 protein [Neisseriaceae bacterium]
MARYAVSIVVLIYKVEDYIEKCAHSLFRQDFESIEYIFINDNTPDQSVQILQKVIEQYPNRKEHIKIIHQSERTHLGHVRGIGLSYATGDYVIYVDSDDWIEPNMISALHQQAQKDDADVVCCDFFMSYPSKEVEKKEPFETAQHDWLKSQLDVSIHSSVWTKLVKKDLYQKIQMPQFSYFEDYFMSIQLLYLAKKVSFVHQFLYHYTQFNSNSFIANIQEKNLISEFSALASSVQTFFEKNQLSNYLPYFYMTLLRPVITLTSGSFVQNIQAICPQANDIQYIWRNDNLSFYRKVCFSMAFFHLEWIPRISKRIYQLLKG